MSQVHMCPDWSTHHPREEAQGTEPDRTVQAKVSMFSLLYMPHHLPYYTMWHRWTALRVIVAQSMVIVVMDVYSLR